MFNCELGLGYGLGNAKFRLTCFIQGGVYIEPPESKRIVDTWRLKNYKIKAGWRMGDRAIYDMASRHSKPYTWRCLEVQRNRLILPNGLALNYPGLHAVDNGQDTGFEYWNGQYMKSTWGGTLMENIIQALARIVLADMMLAIDEYLLPLGGEVVMTVHDEIIAICPEHHAQEGFEYMGEVMSQVPDFANDGLLVLASEGGIADNYSK